MDRRGSASRRSGAERIQPTARPSVAIAIVNQNEVRITSSRRATSSESKKKRKNALVIPARSRIVSTAMSATIVSIFPKPTVPR